MKGRAYPRDTLLSLKGVRVISPRKYSCRQCLLFTWVNYLRRTMGKCLIYLEFQSGMNVVPYALCKLMFVYNNSDDVNLDSTNLLRRYVSSLIFKISISCHSADKWYYKVCCTYYERKSKTLCAKWWNTYSTRIIRIFDDGFGFFLAVSQEKTLIALQSIEVIAIGW